MKVLKVVRFKCFKFKLGSFLLFCFYILFRNKNSILFVFRKNKKIFFKNLINFNIFLIYLKHKDRIQKKKHLISNILNQDKIFKTTKII